MYFWGSFLFCWLTKLEFPSRSTQNGAHSPAEETVKRKWGCYAWVHLHVEQIRNGLSEFLSSKVKISSYSTQKIFSWKNWIVSLKRKEKITSCSVAKVQKKNYSRSHSHKIFSTPRRMLFVYKSSWCLGSHKTVCFFRKAGLLETFFFHY